MQLNSLNLFYEIHYRATIPVDEEPMNYKNMSQVLLYLAKEIVTVFENNINEHFVEQENRFVNIAFEKATELMKIRRRKNFKIKRAKTRRQESF